MGIRIYKLADELGMESKELIEILDDLDIDVSSHMSTIDEETAKLVKEMVAENSVSEDDLVEEDNLDITEETEETEEIEETDDEQINFIEYEGSMTVKELAIELDIQPNTLISELISEGIMATINQELNQDTIEAIAEDYGYEVKDVSVEEEEGIYNLVNDFDDQEEDLELRPPVVTVMGHVDHGKTTLLDAIRESNVIADEAGGITQHIGAYQVDINDKKITFLDTPGHAAFTSMRARGAQATDIAILVVAADDGIMPQTVEAINHAQAAGVEIIVAINKIDKPDAQPERVKQELTEYGLVTEEWGGDTICVPVSALQKQNLDELLEMILLSAEMEELKANPNRPANGVIIEAELDKGRGTVATCLVKNGTLKIGDSIVVGSTHGRVRAMINDRGDRVKQAGPATPVEVLGLSEVPDAGDLLEVLEDDQSTRAIAARRKDYEKNEKLKNKINVNLDNLYSHIQEGEIKELNIVIKADVQGSVEAMRETLADLSTDEVKVNVIHGGVGAITETDVMLASASQAIIIGFSVRPGLKAKRAADKEKIDIRTYRVIYKAVEDVKKAMEGLLDPEFKEVILGEAEVRDTFSVPDVGTVAGCYVKSGKVNRNANIRLIRDGKIIKEGEISSLKRFKDDAKEVAEGYECGIGIEDYDDIKIGDVMEIYDYEEIARTL